MSRLLQVRDAICTAVGALAPGLDVKGHYGAFTDDELKVFTAKAPAVRVSVLAIQDVSAVDESSIDAKVRFGIYVATKDKATIGGRDEQAIALVEAILLLCRRSRWGLGKICKPAETATAQNLYSQGVMADGVALWAIDLRQPVRLEPPAEAPGTLTALFLGIAPDVGAGHQADYVQIGGAA